MQNGKKSQKLKVKEMRSQNILRFVYVKVIIIVRFKVYGEIVDWDQIFQGGWLRMSDIDKCWVDGGNVKRIEMIKLSISGKVEFVYIYGF